MAHRPNRTLQDTDDHIVSIVVVIVAVLFALGVGVYTVSSSIDCDRKCAPKQGVFARQIMSYQCVCVDPEDIKE